MFRERGGFFKIWPTVRETSVNIHERPRRGDGGWSRVLVMSTMQRQNPPNLRVDSMFPIGVAGAKPPGFDARGEGFAAAFEQAAIGMALVDLAGQLLSVNRALCQILGYERQELMSLRFDAILDPRDAKLDFEPIRQLLKGEVEHFHAEKRYVHKQGHVLWILLSVSLVRDAANEPCYFIAQVQDITDRKRAESTFHALLESAPDAMVIASRHGRIVLVNAQTRASFGYDDNELLGQSIEILLPERFRAEHPEHRLQFFANPCARGMGVGNQVFAVRKDGGEFPVEISLSPLDIDETPHVCCAIRDLTQWTHAEETRRRLSAMEHMSNHRSEMAQLLRLNTMSEMAAGIAHELNQPLSAIANYAHGAARRMRRGMDHTEEVLSVIESIGEEAVRASEIIRSVKRYLKKQDAKRVSIDIHEVIDNALRIIGSDVQSRGVELVFERGDGPGNILGDPIELEQVVVNLISNALDALDEVEHAKLILIQTATTPEGLIEVRVLDNGCGLPTLDGVNVFEAFMTTKPEGLGMGLAISRTLIEAHGGRIDAETNEYGGATFRFQLALDNGAV